MVGACPRCGGEIQSEQRFCPHCGQRLGEAPAAERKLVTALFTDLVGSTALGEKLDPEILRLILNRYFEAMTEVIESWGGVVAKYVGDAIVAVFGLPASHGDDADRALHAALAMAMRLESLNLEFAVDHGVTLVTRTGVNTGEVVASEVDQVLLGDVMNTAARLEQAAAPGTTLVGDRTVANLVTSFQLEPTGGIDAKGKSVRVGAHQLVGGPSGLRRRVASHFVGRERELRILTTYFEQVMDTRRPYLVTVAGEPGIGKSTLIGVFAENCRRAGAVVVSGGCLPYGSGIGSWPLREILRTLAGTQIGDTAAAAGAKFAAFVGSLSSDRSLLHALAVGAGITVTDNPLERASAEVIRRELGLAWPAFLSALAEQRPVLVVIEDVHWADPHLIATLDRITLRTVGPVLVVCTARPDFDESAGFGNRTPRARVAVTALDDVEQGELTTRLLPGMPAQEAAALVGVADGNPFFIEEIVAHFLDAGLLREVDGRYVYAVGETSVPDSVRSLLGARIDALDPAAKEVLLAASVIGSDFWVDAVESILDVDDLEAVLETLETEGHVLAARDGSLPFARTFTFRHDLVREVAYTSIPRARAARHHIRVADWIESAVGDRRDEYIETIVNHRAIAARSRLLAWPDDRNVAEDVRSTAFRDLLHASNVVARRAATDDARTFLRDADDLAENERERVLVRLHRARTDRLFDRYTEAWLEYDAALQAAERAALEDLAADASIESATMVGQMGGAIDDSLGWRTWLVQLIERRLPVAEERTKLEEVAALRMASSSLYFWQVEGATAESAHRDALEAVALAERAGSDRVRAPAMDLLAGLTMMMFGLGPALAMVDRVLDAADSAADRVVANELYTTAQWTLTAAGQLSRAEEVGRRHRVEARLLGSHTRIHSIRGDVEIAMARGSFESVRAATDELVALVDEDGGRVCDHGAVAYAARALALTEGGDPAGLSMFDELVERAVPRAQFTAHITSLEWRRPFVTAEVALQQLHGMLESRYVSQAIARLWFAIPLLVRAGDEVAVRCEVRAARELAGTTAAPSLGLLADWAESTIEGRGDAVWEPLERMTVSGRAYTARRLGVDALHVLGRVPPWADALVSLLDDSGAGRSAAEARDLVHAD